MESSHGWLFDRTRDLAVGKSWHRQRVPVGRFEPTSCEPLFASTASASRALLTRVLLQLIQPVTQASGVDSLVQGLCTFVLGICYEYNREPGPITR